jgi:hypothetical protein
MKLAEVAAEDPCGLAILKSVYCMSDYSRFFFADVGNWLSVIL